VSGARSALGIDPEDAPAEGVDEVDPAVRTEREAAEGAFGEAGVERAYEGAVQIEREELARRVIRDEDEAAVELEPARLLEDVLPHEELELGVEDLRAGRDDLEAREGVAFDAARRIERQDTTSTPARKPST
jgi:hypothetical protein